jgi:hypothetical protein
MDFAFMLDLDPQSSTLFVRGRFTPESITRCISSIWRATGHDPLASQRHGRINELVSTSGRKMFIGWAANDTMVLNLSALGGDPSALNWLKEPAAQADSALVDASNLLKSDSFVSVLALVSGRTAQGFPPGIVHLKPEILWVNLAHEDGMTAELGFRFRSENAARQFQDVLMREIRSGSADPLKARLASSLAVSNVGSDLLLILSLNKQGVQDILDAIFARYPGVAERLMQ